MYYMSGKMVTCNSELVNANNHYAAIKMNTAELSEGVYFVKLLVDGFSYTEKIIVQH